MSRETDDGRRLVPEKGDRVPTTPFPPGSGAYQEPDPSIRSFLDPAGRPFMEPGRMLREGVGKLVPATWDPWHELSDREKREWGELARAAYVYRKAWKKARLASEYGNPELAAELMKDAAPSPLADRPQDAVWASLENPWPSQGCECVVCGGYLVFRCDGLHLGGSHEKSCPLVKLDQSALAKDGRAMRLVEQSLPENEQRAEPAKEPGRWLFEAFETAWPSPLKRPTWWEDLTSDQKSAWQGLGQAAWDLGRLPAGDFRLWWADNAGESASAGTDEEWARLDREMWTDRLGFEQALRRLPAEVRSGAAEWLDGDPDALGNMIMMLVEGTGPGDGLPGWSRDEMSGYFPEKKEELS